MLPSRLFAWRAGCGAVAPAAGRLAACRRTRCAAFSQTATLEFCCLLCLPHAPPHPAPHACRSCRRLSHPIQGPEDDGGSAISAYQVEVRPRSAAAVRDLADDWLIAYQVGQGAAQRVLHEAVCCIGVQVHARCLQDCVRLVACIPCFSAAMLGSHSACGLLLPLSPAPLFTGPCASLLPQGRDAACTISSLRAGCSYLVRVCAISAAGTGAFGAAAILETAPSTPCELRRSWGGGLAGRAHCSGRMAVVSLPHSASTLGFFPTARAKLPAPAPPLPFPCLPAPTCPACRVPGRSSCGRTWADGADDGLGVAAARRCGAQDAVACWLRQHLHDAWNMFRP